MFDAQYRRAPRRSLELSPKEQRLAIDNALRYLPPEQHDRYQKIFGQELAEHGRIYGYDFRPEGAIKALTLDQYKGKCIAGRALQFMIDNNLDFEIALYPYELVTYGETGQVMQNWMQYRLTKRYLESMTTEQTLVMMSGHPMGLFPSHSHSPRAIVTNGLMVGMFDNQSEFQRASALGVANYGQMTAGGWMYIGPQGIVHGTFNTLMIAARKLYKNANDLSGRLFLSSGLGGMSGAQGKAAKIAKGVAIIAEVDSSRIHTRHSQGWVDEVYDDPARVFEQALAAQKTPKPLALAYHGNVVDLLEYASQHRIRIDLISDQTSCHVAWDGGYTPQGMSFDLRTKLLATDIEEFRRQVKMSLQKHFKLIQELCHQGSTFFDYGNAFLKSVYDSGLVEVAKNGKDEKDGFIFPSYVEDFLGPELFDYGYGPFRWICLSRNERDLEITDECAVKILSNLRSTLRTQDLDNISWVENAKQNALVVGAPARILYADARGRRDLALAFNKLVREQKIGPIMLGRDHHDTGGTDSPFRETANIKDGSNIMADMATQCFAGNSARGMTLCALHNGGGVGIGKSINGGFGLVLDGTKEVDEIIRCAVSWDVWCGVARRAWAGNPHAIEAVKADAEEMGVLIHNHIHV
jgi:urocanate hydratase